MVIGVLQGGYTCFKCALQVCYKWLYVFYKCFISLLSVCYKCFISVL